MAIFFSKNNLKIKNPIGSRITARPGKPLFEAEQLPVGFLFGGSDGKRIKIAKSYMHDGEQA